MSNDQPQLTEQERAAGLAAALYTHGPYNPDRACDIAQGMLANYAYQRDRLARVADGTATAGDKMAYPDDSHVIGEYDAVKRWLGARRFELVRDEDKSGVSGTGVVGDGVVTSRGVALTWRPEHRSVAFYSSIEKVELIHGHGGKTRVVFAPG